MPVRSHGVVRLAHRADAWHRRGAVSGWPGHVVPRIRVAQGRRTPVYDGAPQWAPDASQGFDRKASHRAATLAHGLNRP